MKKIFLTLALAMAICIAGGAQSRKVVTDSIVFMPSQVQIYEGVTKNGNPKWWIELPAENGVKKVSLSASHVKAGRLLALIERRDENGRYTYSVKFAEEKKRGAGKADLTGIK